MSFLMYSFFFPSLQPYPVGPVQPTVFGSQEWSADSLSRVVETHNKVVDHFIIRNELFTYVSEQVLSRVVFHL